MATLTEEHFRGARYGKLRMKSPVDATSGSHRKVEWLCDCGRTTVVEVCKVVGGNTSSCGQCGLMPAEYWASRKFGKLRMKDPVETFRGTRRKVEWLCDCGRVTRTSAIGVTSGHVSSCGRCDLLSADHFRSAKYGKLRMRDPQDVLPNSHQEVVWLCDCGKEAKKLVYSVVLGHTTSCGQCNLMPRAYWERERFGRLRMKDPQDIHAGSNKKVTWLCDCGREISVEVYAVTALKVRSCGKCRLVAAEWYLRNREEILGLRMPITPDQVPPGWLVPLEAITGGERPFPAVCGVCKSEYRPIWGNVRKGRALTCGCSSHTSFAQAEIARFVRSLGLDAELEHPAGSLRYDMFVPKPNLLIEYNGLKWHSSGESRRRDREKWENAVSHGYQYLMLFEDEWKGSPDKVKALIKNRIGANDPKSVRPSKCEVRRIDKRLSNPFYDAYHYIGRCNAFTEYGVFLQERLIACISFAHPTRQSRHPWELVRMASDPEYRVHGIWSKLLRRFSAEYPGLVVSFSDNRLFSGAVYGRMGFKLDGEVPPDYYWVKGGRRFHKSGLRKKGEERTSGLTERELREAQGYRKIWDLGKKRWVWSPGDSV